jgi:FKBP-type peptidyl-prolyl cis-trans isomerase FklB
MYKQFTAILLITLSGPLLADEKVKLQDEADRINYTIGQQIGKDFNKQQVDLDTAALEKGLQDGKNGDAPLLDATEMQRMLGELKHNITNDMTQESLARTQAKKQQREQKRKVGREFLAANGAKPEVVTTDSGLQYRVLSAGQGPTPGNRDKVRLDYSARTLDGHLFDSSEKKGGPAVVSVNGVLRGFSEALQLMQAGAHWELYLMPELAYGRNGPLAHETVVIDVKLLEILPAE